MWQHVSAHITPLRRPMGMENEGNVAVFPNNMTVLDQTSIPASTMVQYTPSVNKTVKKVRRKHKVTKSSIFNRRDSSEHFENLHVTSPRSCVELYSQDSCEEDLEDEKLAKSLPSQNDHLFSHKLHREKMGQVYVSVNGEAEGATEITEFLPVPASNSCDSKLPKTPVKAWTDVPDADHFLPSLDQKSQDGGHKETSSQLSKVDERSEGGFGKKTTSHLCDMQVHPPLPQVSKEKEIKPNPKPEMSLQELLNKHITPQLKAEGKAGCDLSQSDSTSKKKSLPPIESKKRESRKKEKSGSKRERSKSSRSKSRGKSSQSTRAPSSTEPLPTVLRRFTRPPCPQPLTLSFDYPNTYLTHRYVFDQIKLAIQNVPFGNVNALQFCDRNVAHETAGLDNRWLITLSCPEARDYLLRNGIKLFNNKIYLRRMDDILKQEYRQFARQEKELRRLRGEKEEEDPDDPVSGGRNSGDSDEDDTTSSENSDSD